MTTYPRKECTIFVSHAAADWELAKELKTTIAECLSLDRDRIFLTSDAVSMRTGRVSVNQITESHQQAKAIVALLTPRSVHRPWVLFECGGGHFNPLKVLHVVRANGLPYERLPDLLKEYHAGSLEDDREIKRFCRSLWESVGSCALRLRRKTIARLRNLAGASVGNWGIVDNAPLCVNVFNSPFTVEAVLNSKGVFQARKRVVLFGQSLRFVTESRNRKRIRKAIWEWLSKARGREFTAVVTKHYSPAGVINEPGIGPWRGIFGPIFESHLKETTRIFKTWNRAAQKAGVKFSASCIPFVPCTAMFVDPDDSTNGFAVMGPVVYKPIGQERPQFVIESRHKQVFDYYWRAYDHYLATGGQPI